jgi:hypothetical protein
MNNISVSIPASITPEDTSAVEFRGKIEDGLLELLDEAKIEYIRVGAGMMLEWNTMDFSIEVRDVQRATEITLVHCLLVIGHNKDAVIHTRSNLFNADIQVSEMHPALYSIRDVYDSDAHISQRTIPDSALKSMLDMMVQGADILHAATTVAKSKKEKTDASE